MNDPQFDEIALLRAVRGRDGDPTDAEQARGLAALERQTAAVASGTHTLRQRRPLWRRRGTLWSGIGVVVVGALIGVTIVATPSTVLGPVVSQDPAAEAVALLERSAAVLPELHVEEGQYVRTEVRLQQVMTMPWLADGSDATFRALDRRISYMPADPLGMWTFRSEQGPPSDLIFPKLDSAGARDALAQIAQHASPGIREERIIAGRFPDTEEGAAWAEAAAPEMRAERSRLANAPTDTAELRDFLLAEADPAHMEHFELTEDEVVVSELFEIVADPTMPRRLRAACLQLLAEIPGLAAEPYVPPVHDSSTPSVVVGAGTVVTVREIMGHKFQLIFDTDSARLLGTQAVFTEDPDAFVGVGAGTIALLQSLDVTVVDAIPASEDGW